MIPKLKPFKIEPGMSQWDLQEKDGYLIPPNYGLGIKWKDAGGHKCKSVAHPGLFTKTGKRICRLEESTYVGGVCVNATHYYAHIQASGPLSKDTNTGDVWGMGCYGPERHAIEDFLRRIRVPAKRKLTKVERAADGEIIGHIGDYTARHNTPEQARECALETFKKRFAPGWALFDGEDCTRQIAES